jgi:NAD(P)-dependent dehydrogenase (short-subunit alcohol dehydrogenase family)
MPQNTKERIERYRLDGRVALVTGGARGIGRAISSRLLELGAVVTLGDVDPAVEQTAAELKAAGGTVDWARLDVTSTASVDAAVDQVVARHGRIDVLVANAGISYEEPAEKHTDETWRRVMSINLDGAFRCMRAAGRHMIQAGGGAIVAISSICAVTAVRPELHIGYDVSKAGVAHLCRNLAIEWARHRIRINAVGPGYTDTQILAEVGRTRPEVMKVWLEDMPTHRLLDPSEIADAVAFLASDAARGITGHQLMVDAGYSAA